MSLSLNGSFSYEPVAPLLDVGADGEHSKLDNFEPMNIGTLSYFFMLHFFHCIIFSSSEATSMYLNQNPNCECLSLHVLKLLSKFDVESDG